mgnify:CR=1 FL=1
MLQSFFSECYIPLGIRKSYSRKVTVVNITITCITNYSSFQKPSARLTTSEGIYSDHAIRSITQRQRNTNSLTVLLKPQLILLQTQNKLQFLNIFK